MEFIVSYDTESDEDTHQTEESNTSSVPWPEDDFLCEMEEFVYEYIDEFFTLFPLIIANDNFHTIIVNDTCYALLSILEDMYEQSDERVEEIEEYLTEFVKQRFDVYMNTVYYQPRQYVSDVEHNNGHQNSTHLSSSIQMLQDKIETLSKLPQPQQKSKEWYEFRNNLLTATNIGKILSSESSRNSVILEKCRPPKDLNSQYVNTQSTLHWGNKYEPLSAMVYEDKYKTTVKEFGCIKHNQIHCIGASPDGINVDSYSERFGRMLEIKNIVNREINGIPLTNYWVQMQIQMEVCDLDLCDFFETRFKEYGDWRELFTDAAHQDRGIILYFIRKDVLGSSSNTPHYVYMPLHIQKSLEGITEWIEQIKSELETTHVLYETIGWYLDEYSCVLVPRNKQWFAAALPKIEETWNTILKEREHGCEHRVSKPLTIKVNKLQPQCFIDMQTLDTPPI